MSTPSRGTSAKRTALQERTEVETDDGRVPLPAVSSAAETTVVVWAEGYATAFVACPAELRGEVAVALRRPVTVRVRVSDPAGRPAFLAKVRPVDGRPGWAILAGAGLGSATTDRLGRATLTVAPGRLTLHAERGEMRCASGELEVQAAGGGEIALQLERAK